MGWFKVFYLSCILCVTSVLGSTDRVKLKDVEVLTLKVGHFTNGRRSPGVPQIRCVGGTAGCQAFVPQVVQCYNRGFDGVDYQWECKADMDGAYRFGSVSISCEGYDYPDDPYILKGSCGLEYTIDLTQEGYDHKSYQQQSSYSTFKNHKGSKSGITLETITLFAGVGIVVYAVYKTCIAPTNRTDQRSSTNDDYPGRPDGGPRSNPPPPGFRSDYFPSGNRGGDSCSGSSTSGAGTSGTGTGGGGFWTGAATGGLLGYMFGSRNSGPSTSGYMPRSSQPGWTFDNWGTPGPSYSGAGSSGPSTSSGSRTTSGFGAFFFHFHSLEFSQPHVFPAFSSTSLGYQSQHEPSTIDKHRFKGRGQLLMRILEHQSGWTQNKYHDLSRDTDERIESRGKVLDWEKTSSLTGTGYKRMPVMPPEQREKILDMHKDSRANAGIYVAVVLAVYVILLTILLCRYARRQRLIEDTDEENPAGLLNSSCRKLRRLKALLCCYQSTPEASEHTRTRLTATMEATELHVNPNQDHTTV
ncbi:unnamed protein product [Allacma fusca]|uniref:Store-operated calcium entry-associated regulatory factor n=1 Tax=Allacma fusca TaxID=39272 RepID=A0A8J2J7X7_9HEXA|nr:unnamed protein product [Allacma fusca]